MTAPREAGGLPATPVAGRRPEVLVITTDPLTEAMPGPSIRAWHLAEVLSAGASVTLVSTVACDRTHPSMEVLFEGDTDLRHLAARCDVIVAAGGVVRRHPFISRATTPLVIDIYDPYHLETLASRGGAGPDGGQQLVAALNAEINEDLARGDFFLCASQVQRDFWLGALTANGRVNPATYRDDPLLERLVSVVPFGVDAEEPVRRGPGLRRRFPAIGPSDPVLLWGGGVYEWFDPLSLVRAVELLTAGGRVPDLRLVFMAMSHPNPGTPDMPVARELRRLSEELGLTGRHVFFNEEWIPYDERAGFLLDADLGVSTHPAHLETRYSFRTRILDYIWAGLPMVLTEGDALADMVTRAGAGTAVPAGDVGGIARAIEDTLAHPPGPDAFDDLRRNLHWTRVAAPLVSFCHAPVRAPDLVSSAAAPAADGERSPADATTADPAGVGPGEVPDPVLPLSTVLRRETARLLAGGRRRLAARRRRAGPDPSG